MLHLIGTYFPLFHVLSFVGYLFSSFHYFIPSLIALSTQAKHSTHKKQVRTPTNLANYRVIKYIREAYLAQKSRSKAHHSIHMHRNHFEIELNLASS